MDYLDNIYFDNTLRSYLIISGTILAAFLLKKFLSRYVASLLFRILRKSWNKIDKQQFVNLALEPLEWFLLLVISFFAVDKLNFPAVLDFKIYHATSKDIIDIGGKGVIIIAFFWLLLRIIDFVALVLENKALETDNKTDDQLIIFFRDFLKVIVSIAGLLLILKVCFSQHIGNLLTGLSLVGAAMALAAKESLENLIASFIIFFDKPFFTGDTLKVNNLTGIVERIGLRSTRIRTPDKTLVTVPNKQMVDSVVDNWSMRTNRRAEIKLELSGKTSLPVTNIIIEGLKKILHSNEQKIVSSSVFLKEVNKNGLMIVTEYFTAPVSLNDFDTLKQEINLVIKQLLEENHVEMAGETSTIIIDGNKEMT